MPLKDRMNIDDLCDKTVALLDARGIDDIELRHQIEVVRKPWLYVDHGVSLSADGLLANFKRLLEQEKLDSAQPALIGNQPNEVKQRNLARTKAISDTLQSTRRPVKPLMNSRL